MGAQGPHPISPDLMHLNTKGFVQKGSGWEEATSKTDCVPQCGKSQPPTCHPIPSHTCPQRLLGTEQVGVCVPALCPHKVPRAARSPPTYPQKSMLNRPGNGQCQTSFCEKQSGTEPEQKTNTEFYLICILSLEPCLAHIRHPTNNTSPQICSSQETSTTEGCTFLPYNGLLWIV